MHFPCSLFFSYCFVKKTGSFFNQAFKAKICPTNTLDSPQATSPRRRQEPREQRNPQVSRIGIFGWDLKPKSKFSRGVDSEVDNISDLICWDGQFIMCLHVVWYPMSSLFDTCLVIKCISNFPLACLTGMLILSSDFPMISGAEFRTVWWCSIFRHTCHILSHVTHSWLHPYFSW